MQRSKAGTRRLINCLPRLHGLMQQLTSWADADGVGCYLETSKPRNVPFYQCHGFQITKEIDVIGVHIWMMWRLPGKKS